MLIDKYNGWHNQGLIFFAVVLLTCGSLFSHPAGAVLIEGTVKGMIVENYTEGNKPKSTFFDLVVAGQSFSADFWYEFDENNFPPTYASGSFREYDFGFSAMGITVHVGDESFSSTAPNIFPLTHFRNMIDIYRGDFYSQFRMTTYNVYSAVNPRTNNRMVDIDFNSTAMAQFSGLDLIQNVSIESLNGSALGAMHLMDYGTIDGDRYPGDLYDFDGNVYGDIYSIDIGVRRSTVDESGSLGLITLALLMIGWRYHGYIIETHRQSIQAIHT